MSEQEFWLRLDKKIEEITLRTKRLRTVFLTIIGVMAIGILTLGATNIIGVSQNTMRSMQNEDKLKNAVTTFELGMINELHELQTQITTAKIAGDDQAYTDLMKEFYNVRRALISNMSVKRGGGNE